MQTIDTSTFFPELPPAPPENTPESGYSEIFSTLDPLQRAATLSDGHTLCAARPGSGKTRVLIAKLLRGIIQHGPESVLAITFTRASTQEMRTRLEHYAGMPVAKKTTVSTFHALSVEKLRRQLRLRIIDDRDRFLVLIQYLQDNNVRYPVDKLISAISSYFNREESVLALLPQGVTQTLAQYDEYLSSNHLMDLDSVIPYLADLVESNAIKMPFKLLLVDEFQDLDPSQIRLVSALASKGTEVFCVGDDDQSIYGFRRSLGPMAFHILQRDLPAQLVFLSTNYRCAKAIAQSAEYPLLALSDRIDKPLIIYRDGGLVRGLHFKFPEMEMQEAAGYCLEQVASGHTAAILSRTNNLLDAMEGVLRTADIPYARTDSRSFWDGEAVRKCLSFLTLPFSPSRHELYVALHAIPLPYDTIKGVIAHFQGALPNTFSREDLFNNLYSRAITDPMETEHAENFRQWRRAFSDWADSCDDQGQWDAARRAFAFFIQCARKPAMISTANILDSVFQKPDRQGNPVSIRTRLQWLAMPRTQNMDDHSVIRLMTIHGSKGLEFDLVWLMGARKGILPHEEAESEDEERRTFYVAMTRAINELVISNSAEQPDLPSPPFSFSWLPPSP